MPDLNIWIERILNAWIGFAFRWRLLIVPALIIASGLALFYTINHISVNTNTRDMLSPDLDWRQLDLAYENAFPMYVENIVVVIEANTPDQATDAAAYTKEILKRDSKQYQQVFLLSDLDYFRDSALLYLNERELQDLADRLAQIQPFLGQLIDDQSLRGLFNLLEQAIKARRDGQTVELKALLERISAVATAVNQEQRRYLSWQNLITGEKTPRETYREFIFIKPRIDYSSLLPAKDAIETARNSIAESGLASRYDARARLTGNATLAYEELQSVSQGTGIAALLALIVVTCILIIGLRSARLVFAAVITLLCGLLLTAAMATATVGELNLISVAFAVLYIGLGVDFAVHFCLRFRELHMHEEIPQALQLTGTSVGRSLLLCTLTTAIGLYAFIPTDYRGIAELGWISGTGMFISLFVTLTLLPALLALLAPAEERPQMQRVHPFVERLALLPDRYSRSICLGALLLALLAAASLPAVRFDSSTLNLQSPSNESVQTYRDLMHDSNASPLTGIVLTRDAKEAQQFEKRFEAVNEVKDVRTIWDFVPENQPAKLAIIDELSFLLGPMLASTEADTAISAEERGQALNDLLGYLDTNPPGDQEPILADLYSALQTLSRQIEQQPDTAAGTLAKLEEYLLSNLPGRLQMLHDGLNAETVSIESMPAPLRDRWLSPAGWYLVDILPREPLDNEQAMRDFVEALSSHTDQLIGAPVIQLEAADSVVDAFIEAFILAFSVITVLLLVLLRSLRDTLLALAPIALAALLTAAVTVLVDIPFNFANIIALPLLLGIGIDNSIHILQRYHIAPTEPGMLLRTSVSRAILISALTTIFSIGNLAFSAHAGTASMGLLLALGVSISLICALILLPSLLALKNRR